MEHGVARGVVSSVTACICLALYAGGCASPGAGNLREDESALQGSWEQQAMEGQGEKGQRVVKEVKGDTETVTTYDIYNQARITTEDAERDAPEG